MTSVAFIGTREYDQLPPEWKELYEAAVDRAVRAGCVVRTGAAPGADQVAAERALRQGGKVMLCLPWAEYEQEWHLRMIMLNGYHLGALNLEELVPQLRDRWLASVDQYHPNPQALVGHPQVRALHARNYGIVAPSKCVIAVPQRPESGGTGQGIRIARGLGIRCYDLSVECDRRRLQMRLSIEE